MVSYFWYLKILVFWTLHFFLEWLFFSKAKLSLVNKNLWPKIYPLWECGAKKKGDAKANWHWVIIQTHTVILPYWTLKNRASLIFPSKTFFWIPVRDYWGLLYQGTAIQALSENMGNAEMSIIWFFERRARRDLDLWLTSDFDWFGNFKNLQHNRCSK